MKNKYKAFIRDILLFTLSTFIPKAISFILMPIYTGYLTTAEYGLADIISTTVSLLVPILSINISDAVMRFTIENKDDERPMQYAIRISMMSIFFLTVIVGLNLMLDIFKINPLIQIFFLLQFVFNLLYGINISYIRAKDKVGLITVISIVNTISILISNILLIVIFKMGIIGYMTSTVIGMAVSNIIIILYMNIYKNNILCPIYEKNKLAKQMIGYSFPLIISNIAWWVNSVSDRYLVTYFLGINKNGVYSVAYKIPTILQLMQSVFSQAWLLSLYREYKNDNGKDYVSKIFEMYYVVMSIGCAILIILDIPLAKFLYSKDFYEAWEYVPALLISVVFIACAGFYESLLTLNKDSKKVAISAFIGASINILLNIILIPLIGVMGAAIATAVGYLGMWIIRIIFVNNSYKFKVKRLKICFILVLLVSEAYIMVKYKNFILSTVITIIMIIANYRVVKELIKNRRAINE